MFTDALRQISLFRSCQDSFFREIAAEALDSKHPKGKILFLHEDKATRFYLIRSGWVKLFRETLDGTQAVVDIIAQGHIFGDTAIFENDHYPYSAEVVEPADIVSFPLAPFKAEIENNAKFAYDMLAAMARYRKQQDREIEHRSIQNAAQRIGCFLLRLTKQDETGTITIQLPYDKMLVASRLGMQPETFSRALKKLKEETGIHIKGSTIKLDTLEQLSHYSCAACSSEFPCKDLVSTDRLSRD